MKKFLLMALALGFAQLSISQTIDWKSYQDPDGDYKRLFINPELSYDSRKNIDADFGSFQLNLNSTFQLDKIRNLSILRFSIYQDFDFESFKNRKLGLEADNRLSIQISPYINYRKYLSTRRGLFLEGSIASRLSHNSINANNKFRDFTRFSGFLGFGRLENVAPLYQAIRIKNQIKSNALESQESLFSLAQSMRLLDYNTTLDSRMLSIDNQTIYLNTLKDLGVSLDDFASITNALDAYKFERPNIVANGFQGRVGLNYETSFDKDRSDVLGSLSLAYAKAINSQWHWSISSEISSAFDNDWNLNFFTRLSYFPSARTTIQLSQNFLHRELDSFSLTNTVTNLSARYFVSPYVSVFGSMNYNYSGDNGIIGTEPNHSLSQNIGFSYYIF